MGHGIHSRVPALDGVLCSEDAPEISQLVLWGAGGEGRVKTPLPRSILSIVAQQHTPNNDATSHSQLQAEPALRPLFQSRLSLNIRANSTSRGQVFY